MRKVLASLGLAMIFATLASGCSTSSDQPQKEDRSRTQSVGKGPTSPVGTWGQADKESVKVEGSAWGSFYKDGTALIGDGCQMVQTKWEESRSIIDLTPLQGGSIPQSGASEENCAGRWSGTIDTAKATTKSIQFFDIDGKKLADLPMVSRDPNLAQNAMSALSMNKGADIAACIQGMNVTRTSEEPNPECPTQTSAPTQSFDEDKSYTNRFGASG